jgi:hypothetical protein
MEELRKAFINRGLGGLDFAQKGLDPIYGKNDIETILSDFDRMDCPQYRNQFPIVQRAAKDSILVDYTPAMAGEFIDMGVYMSGNPECWLESQQTPKKTINLKVEYGIYCKYSAKEAAAWLSEILNLYYSLVKKYNVSILVEWRTTARSKNASDIVYTIPLVTTGEYLNEAKAQYIFSPIFYRLFIFGYYHKNQASDGFRASKVSEDSYQKGPRKEGDFFIIPSLYNRFFDDKDPDFDKMFLDIQKLYK